MKRNREREMQAMHEQCAIHVAFSVCSVNRPLCLIRAIHADCCASQIRSAHAMTATLQFCTPDLAPSSRILVAALLFVVFRYHGGDW